MTSTKALRTAPPATSRKSPGAKKARRKGVNGAMPIRQITDISSLVLDKKMSKEEFTALAARFPDLRMEREKNGKTTIMSPVKFGTGKRELHLGIYLGIWWKEKGEPGEVFGASTGVELADTAIKSPDCGWISPERAALIDPADEDGEYLKVAPDFIAEIRSKTDSLAKLKRKMKNSWMKNGVRLAWLIDPYKERAYVYREGQEVEEIKWFEGKVLNGEKVLPGFVLELEKMKIKGWKKG
ncbi:MAG TPA: Uma2 family endonuclease [Bacteroidetes bacterium]|nr:Uma2 family endonuclease [Bacteroidota bacterium]